MPGPDPICSSRTPQLPPDLERGLPVGTELDTHSHGAAVVAADVAAHLAADGIGEFVLPGAAGMADVAVGGVAFQGWVGGGGILLALSSAVTLGEIALLPSESATGGMLASALRAGSAPEERAMVLGYAAGLSGMSEREIAALREHLPEGLRTWFQNGLANHADDASREPACAAEAREQYRHLMRSFADGTAAAIGGWTDPDRGEAFAAGRERMQRYLESHPCEAEQLRGEYRAAFRDGFRAADGAGPDLRRYERDAAYRAGVEHEQRLEHGGDPAALEAERRRIGGVSVRELAGGRIAG